MCKKQAGGLGDYLHKLDPRREWTEHLPYIIIFCQTHVQRNFRKKFGDHPAKYKIRGLWEASTTQEILEHIQCLSTEYPELKHWLENKKPPWILSGLAAELSKIPYLDWIYARKHTGLSESSHFQDNNYTGRKLSLLAAVLRLKKHTNEVFAKYKQQVTQGVSPIWRNQNPTMRRAATLKQQDRRQQQAAKRRRKHTHLPYDPDNPYDTPLLEPAAEAQSVASSDTCSTYAPHTPRRRQASSRNHRAQSVSQSSAASDIRSTYTLHTPSHARAHPLSMVETLGSDNTSVDLPEMPLVRSTQALNPGHAQHVLDTSMVKPVSEYTEYILDIDPMEQRLKALHERKRKRDLIKEISKLEEEEAQTDQSTSHMQNTCIVC
ncbi:hypothetical protein BO71DRAFT_136463 [Aspergillus ellipticus CBS 707.79]|uniref:Uncharacterized protein n=1 Tax=Aspergillus ellipticus CBS 707.79 TaxID=1448320 RepID=A0A319CT29_9EURO|nr:hypothetical protein BO71DRAFT_136463 [Aspergillus ellipticus CBS 707.79]